MTIPILLHYTKVIIQIMAKLAQINVQSVPLYSFPVSLWPEKLLKISFVNDVAVHLGVKMADTLSFTAKVDVAVSCGYDTQFAVRLVMDYRSTQPLGLRPSGQVNPWLEPRVWCNPGPNRGLYSLNQYHTVDNDPIWFQIKEIRLRISQPYKAHALSVGSQPSVCCTQRTSAPCAVISRPNAWHESQSVGDMHSTGAAISRLGQHPHSSFLLARISENQAWIFTSLPK